MNNLTLAWETFDFLTINISELEARHLNNVDTIQNFFTQTKSPTKEQKKRLRSKLETCLNSLLVLYVKQLQCIDDLLELNDSGQDIPEEQEIDLESLITLKNITATLLEQMKLAKIEYDSFFI